MEQIDVSHESGSDGRSREELARALAEAEEALRARDEFLRIAGHQLRSPLTAVQLQADSLTMIARLGATSDEIEERVARVLRSVHRVTWLVEEVVDLGRVSGGRLALQVGPADLAQLARKVVDRFGDELRRAGCEVRLDASTPVRGSWDVARLEHTLGSLVLAAIKSGGGHPIEVAVIPADGDGGARDSACVAVRDGGEGLPDEERALVFGRFEPLLAGLKAGSPVLGLWLGRAVLEAHGGRLVLAPGLATLHLPKTGGGDSGLIRES